MPSPLIDPSKAHQLGGATVARIDATLDVAAGTVTVTAFRDPTGLVPITEIAGTPAETAAKVRLGMHLVGSHLARVEEVTRAQMEMLKFVMDRVLDDEGNPVLGHDGAPLVSETFLDAYRHLAGAASD